MYTRFVQNDFPTHIEYNTPDTVVVEGFPVWIKVLFHRVDIIGYAYEANLVVYQNSNEIKRYTCSPGSTSEYLQAELIFDNPGTYRVVVHVIHNDIDMESDIAMTVEVKTRILSFMSDEGGYVVYPTTGYQTLIKLPPCILDKYYYVQDRAGLS